VTYGGFSPTDLEGVLRTPARAQKDRPQTHQIDAVELSSCHDQTDRQCSSKVQQPHRLTSDRHRPDL